VIRIDARTERRTEEIRKSRAIIVQGAITYCLKTEYITRKAPITIVPIMMIKSM
jgi:hypothetical protein